MKKYLKLGYFANKIMLNFMKKLDMNLKEKNYFVEIGKNEIIIQYNF